MSSVEREPRQARRPLLRVPGFSLAATRALVLGIGAKALKTE